VILLTRLHEIKKRPIQIIDLIKRTERKNIPSSDIYYLLAKALKTTKTFLHTHPEFIPSWHQIRVWRRYEKKRLRSVPAAYITGEKEFYSLNFRVTRFVRIPRPETELIVEELLDERPLHLLDIGTGSGNIAITVQYYCKESKIVACDISRRALHIAKTNAEIILKKNTITFMRSNYYQRLDNKKFDVIVSNPPYIQNEDFSQLQKEIRLYEPPVALKGGEDGLDAYRKIIQGGKAHLNSGGKIILEISGELVDGLTNIAVYYGWRVVQIKDDYAGIPRVMILEPVV